ncbi:pirin family protein [Segeticoccus rhizosphaerae]|uniref:pirin family protein n=1 Tax=Segeticoccus rhizosphaerae TaxID=1104777 RepID=UPI00126534F0|nr:pirin family protein [Segeticoccus rhizosphaerae]
MSNTIADVYRECTDDVDPHGREITVYDAIRARISPRDEVLRLLPHRERRMVGAWCFADLFGPRDITGQTGMTVPPHPHIGLQTVSWLVEGTVLHRDSLGTTALVEPGRVGIMTAGHGIAHSENSPDDHGPVLHGAQLWVALPEAARHGEHAFTLHEPAPVWSRDGLSAQVFVGRVGDVSASAQGVTPLVGADLAPEAAERREGTLPLDTAYEHLLLPLRGSATVPDEAGHPVEVTAGQAMYLGTDRSALEVTLSPDARVLLLGGEPFEEEIVMWWNFVGRTHDEIARARQEWNGHDPRFGEVSHYPGPERLVAPPLPHVTLRPRGRRH